MNSNDRSRITVGEPNWAPLEMVLSPRECEDYMHMGRAGDIELYKHRFTRRYLNISSDGRRFYRLHNGIYVEIGWKSALDYVRN